MSETVFKWVPVCTRPTTVPGKAGDRSTALYCVRQHAPRHVNINPPNQSTAQYVIICQSLSIINFHVKLILNQLSITNKNGYNEHPPLPRACSCVAHVHCTPSRLHPIISGEGRRVRRVNVLQMPRHQRHETCLHTPPAEVKVTNGKGRGRKRKAAPSYVCKVWRKRFSRPNIELSINCSITVKGSAVYITDGGREGQRSHAGDYSTRGQWGDVGRTAMEGRAGRERKRTKPPRFI